MEEKVCQESAAVSASPNNANAADACARKKIFTIIYAVVLVAALAGTVQLLYNAIDYFIHSPLSHSADSIVKQLQIPLAVMALLAAVVSIAFVTLLVVSLCKKNGKTKLNCLVVSIACVVALLVLIFVCCGLWESYYQEEYGTYYVGNGVWLAEYMPYNVGRSGTEFALYSAVMAMLVTQLVYVAVLGALHIWDYVKTQKDQKAATQNAVTETAGEPITEPEVTTSATDGEGVQ